MNEKYKNPLYLLIFTTIYLFLSEACVMVFLAFFPGLPVWSNALVDAVFLILLALPILYFFLFKPLIHHITTREQAERELQLAHDLLEKKVEERTHELSESNAELKCLINNYKESEQERRQLERQLQQSQKMEAIGTMAGGIAHDFNNILSIIVNANELALVETPKESKAAYYNKTALKATTRAKDLIQQILAFSRQTESTLVPVKPYLLLEEDLKLIRSTIPATIEITEDIEKSNGYINTEPTQFNQLLMNLCTNAVHAMDEKGILEIQLKEVQLEQKDLMHKHNLSPGRYYQLAVSDTGCGMLEKDKERIFEPFYTTKEVGEGTGLGLAVVHGIVEGHRGMVTVDSEKDQGTTFRVYFPIIETAKTFDAEVAEKFYHGNEHILFVDDEKLVTEMAGKSLEILGYKVTPMFDSLKALEAFKLSPEKYDLVITDQTMPKMTGIEFAEELMKIRSNIPIILCSGQSYKESKEYMSKLGIKEVVPKPFYKEQIAKVIRKVLDS